jgi:hypothetical protein
VPRQSEGFVLHKHNSKKPCPIYLPVASGSDPSGLSEVEDTSWLHSGEDTFEALFRELALQAVPRSSAYEREPDGAIRLFKTLARCDDCLSPRVLSVKSSSQEVSIFFTSHVFLSGQAPWSDILHFVENSVHSTRRLVLCMCGGGSTGRPSG